MRGGPVSRILLYDGLPRPQTTIPLGHMLPRGSSCQPGSLGPKPPCPDMPRAASDGREIPIRHCSRWGLPCGRCCHPPGGLLPHRFTLTAPIPRTGPGGTAVCFLWRCPSGCPARALPGTGALVSPDFPLGDTPKRPSAPPRAVHIETLRPRRNPNVDESLRRRGCVSAAPGASPANQTAHRPRHRAVRAWKNAPRLRSRAGARRGSAPP